VRNTLGMLSLWRVSVSPVDARPVIANIAHYVKCVTACEHMRVCDVACARRPERVRDVAFVDVARTDVALTLALVRAARDRTCTLTLPALDQWRRALVDTRRRAQQGVDADVR
jgi:hypothetical protein